MRPIQSYLSVIEKNSLSSLIFLILFIYIGISLTFGIVYYFWDLFAPVAKGAVGGFWNALYFSFVTQTTLGYGDFSPRGAGKVVVVVHTCIGMLFLALGTGAVIVRMVTPGRDAIIFDDNLIFYPKERRFRTRLVNRLSVQLAPIEIEMRLRYRRKDEHGTRMSRRRIQLLQPRISYLPSLYPMATSALAGDTEPVPLAEVPLGQELHLNPTYLEDGHQIVFDLSAQYSLGRITTQKTFEFENIFCGHNIPTVVDSEEVNLNNLNSFEHTDPKTCNTCIYESGCFLKHKLPKAPAAKPDG